MAKVAYRSIPAKGGTTPHCLQTTMQKMAQIEKRVQIVVQCAEACAVIFAEKIAEIDDAESCADFCAVLHAEGLQKNGTDAETFAETGAEMAGRW